MKTLICSASAVALTLLIVGAPPASAQSAAQKPSASKCEWQPAPQFGPRAPLRAPACVERGDQRKTFTGKGGPECDPSYTGKGHYVWRQRPQAGGPRAPLLAPERVWLEAC